MYWVPATTDEDVDPETRISHIYDNRHRIATRVKLLTERASGRASFPPRSMRRLISNVEVAPAAGGELVAESNFILVELSAQARPRDAPVGAAAPPHRLRRVDGALKMSYKKVVLGERRRAAAESLVSDLNAAPIAI